MKMRTINSLLCLALLVAGVFLTSAALPGYRQLAAAGQEEQQPDKRKKTTVQHATLAVDDKEKAIDVLYLDLPYGEKTFSYLEKGGNDYYSRRTWPMAHLKLAVPAKYNGHALKPGDYIFIITPRNGKANPSMTMSLASYQPESADATFLVPGDVFTDTPENTVRISRKAVRFAKGAPMEDHLKIDVEQVANSKVVNINIHYGDRTHTEKLLLN